MDQEAIDKAVKELRNHLNVELNTSIDHLSDEYSKLQVGRAHAGLVEGILVDAYGDTQPLKNVAGISIPDPKQIMIQPWDKSLMGIIEKAIRTSGLDLNPINDGVGIRIVLPELTEERRKDLVKVVHKIAEESKIRVRKSRQHIHNKMKQMEKEKEISKDKLEWEEGDIQKKIDEFNHKIDEAAKKKEKMILTI